MTAFDKAWVILKQNMMDPYDAQQGMPPWGNPPPNDPYNPTQPGGGPQDKFCKKCRYAPLKTPEEILSGVCNHCARYKENTPWKFPHDYEPNEPNKPNPYDNPPKPSPYDNPPPPPSKDGYPAAGWTKCRRCNGTGKIQGNTQPYYNLNKSESFLERFVKGERIYKLYIPGHQPWDEKPNEGPYRPPNPQTPPWDNPKGIPYEPIDCPDCYGKGIIPPKSDSQRSAESSA